MIWADLTRHGFCDDYAIYLCGQGWMSQWAVDSLVMKIKSPWKRQTESSPTIFTASMLPQALKRNHLVR